MTLLLLLYSSNMQENNYCKLPLDTSRWVQKGVPIKHFKSIIKNLPDQVGVTFFCRKSQLATIVLDCLPR